MAKIIAYVDGFNTYYGLFKGKNDRPPLFPPKFKWLNWVAVIQKLFPDDELIRVRYFTARVLPTRSDPRQPERQNLYFDALGSIATVRITLGNFKLRRDELPLWEGGEIVSVARMEEKGSDVNLASFLLLDAFKGQFEKAVIVSNDSDLEMPVKLAKEQLAKEVQIVNPTSDKDVLKTSVSKPNLRLSESVLAACQFSSPLTLKTGRVLRKPDSWA